MQVMQKVSGVQLPLQPMLAGIWPSLVTFLLVPRLSQQHVGNPDHE